MRQQNITKNLVPGSMELLWHSIEIDDVVTRLKSDSAQGLSQDEAELRLKQYGPNALPDSKHRSIFSIVLHQFLSPLIYLLLGAAAVAFLIGEAKDALVILVVVFLNAIIGAIQEGRAEHSLEALRKLSTLKSRVLRGGQEEILEASLIVPGDIILLAAGDAIPADARLLDAAALAVAEAALTGESVPVTKSTSSLPKDTLLADRRNMLYAGTHVTAGRTRALVVTTGTSNEIGKIAAMASTAIQPKTQLELRIHQFGRYLVVLALVVFALVMGIGFLRGISLSEIFMIAISQMVSLVPEGLPVAVTIALAVGVQRMAKRGTIVRRLSAVETLGSTTIICSDKTGTLTRNEMTVTAIYLPGAREISITGVGYVPEGKLLEEGGEITLQNDGSLRRLFEIGALCNDSELLSPDGTNSGWRTLGDPTEAALLTLSAKAGLDPTALRRTAPRRAELPFDADTKMMATQHDTPEGTLVYIKGAPDVMLDFYGSVYLSGNIEPIDDRVRADIQAASKKMADQALRVLAFGFVKNAHVDGSKGFAPFRGHITFVGLVGELDPPRTEVRDSVRECQAAGIRPVMVTGDHKATGLAIAQMLGISRDGDLAVDGRELDKLSDDELFEKLRSITVFARVHPAQKLRIVEAYQKAGEVVAMTGDGVNDAPALVRANVGVAMGITGTEVAKEAAKIVITDDNFATIVKAVAEGRLVYRNIKKVILYLFSTSSAEVVVLFVALILGFPPPLAAVQILWINLVTEGTVTVNLIMEPMEGDEMRRRPVPPNEPLLTRGLLSRMALMTPTIAASTLLWFFYRTSTGISASLVQSETFTVLAVCQWFNVLNCRSESRSALRLSLLTNPWLLGGLVLGNVLHAAVIYWPPLSRLFHTVPIAVDQFLAIGAVGSIVLWVEELRKLIYRRKLRRSHATA